jgi:hypothetical protein
VTRSTNLRTMQRMRCCLGFAIGNDGDAAFSVDASAVTFGAGAIAEVGSEMRALGGRRIALFTDARLASLSFVNDARESLQKAGCDVAVYDRVVVEPTDVSFREAAAFAAKQRSCSRRIPPRSTTTSRRRSAKVVPFLDRFRCTLLVPRRPAQGANVRALPSSTTRSKK